MGETPALPVWSERLRPYKDDFEFAMTNPRSLIHALYLHWDIIENLVLLSREFPAFEQEQVLPVIARCAPTKSLEEHEAVLRQLASSELLQSLPRGTALQIHPLILAFVRSLTREHELGLSEVLRARVEAVKNATVKLNESLQARDTDQLRLAAVQLAELFRQISQQLDQDRHAILELAERAKSADANLPIARRYSEVLAAYDEYVAPMAEMMDSGPAGTFYRHLESAEHALDHAVETLTVQGALYTQRLAMRQVAFQAKELRRLGREVHKQCSDTLLPLREEIRQHNALSSAISQLLGRVRKRGLGRSLGRGGLPVWRRDMPRRVGVGHEVLAIMGEAMRFQPLRLDFPEEAVDVDPLGLDRVDEPALLKALASALPIDNLLHWLFDGYPELSDLTLLRLYHNLIDRQDWQVALADDSCQVDLHTVRVTHYPHGLSKTSKQNAN